MIYYYSVNVLGVKVTEFEQKWLVTTFPKFLGVEISETDSKILAFSLYAKIKILKTKQKHENQDVFIKIVRFLQAYETDFELMEVEKQLQKCFSLFDSLGSIKKETLITDKNALEFDQNGILVGRLDAGGNSISIKMIEFANI